MPFIDSSAKRTKEDDTMPYGFFSRLFEYVIVFAISCYLIRLGICWLLSVRVPILVIVVSTGIVVLAYRTYRWRKRHDDY